MSGFALPLLAPLLLLATAALFIARPGRRPGALPLIAEIAVAGAFALGLLGLGQWLVAGPMSTSVGDLVVARLDAVTVTLTLLVSFVGWVVVRYARRYVDGEAREGVFHGLTLTAIAAVLLIVQAGNLLVLTAGFIATGLVLRQVLLFYAERAEARRAAAKFSRVWSVGDAALILATLLLWQAFGTFNIAALNQMATNGLPTPALVAVALLIVAAALKTAAFPVHGWLTEVMEAPTPVSALLHAGIINSGGVLLILTAGLDWRTDRGWYLDLTADNTDTSAATELIGERVLVSPVNDAGMLDVTTFAPADPTNPCSPGGATFLYRFDLTGNFSRNGFEGLAAGVVGVRAGEGYIGGLSRLFLGEEQGAVVSSQSTTQITDMLRNLRTRGGKDRRLTTAAPNIQCIRVGTSITATAGGGQVQCLGELPLRVWRPLR